MKQSSSAKATQVYLVEDHPVYAEGLLEVLKDEPGLAVCGQAGSAEQAWQEIPQLAPQLLLVDITLPGISGLELIHRVRSVYPKIKILVISMREEQQYAARVLQAGGDGYIMKQQDPEEIVNAIRDTLDGHLYVSEEVLFPESKIADTNKNKRTSRPVDCLSDLQLEILGQLGAGKSNAEISRLLDLGGRSLASHRSAMQKKLGVSNSNALVRFAVGWMASGQT